MTKLIRLESDNNLTESQFTNNLAVALQLGKNASVALKTLSMQFKQPPITINSKNSLVRFKTNNASTEIAITRDAFIPEGSYTIPDLMTTLQRKMNGLVDSKNTASSDEGLEWLCSASGSASEGYKSNIAFVKSDNATITAADCNTKLVLTDTMAFTSGVVKKTASNNGLYNAVLVSNKYISMGSWLAGIQITNQDTSDIKLSKWAFGLGDHNFRGSITDTDIISNMLCGWMRNAGGGYSYKAGGVMHDTNMSINTGDVLKITKRVVSSLQTKVVYVLTQAGTDFTYDGDIVQNSALETIGDGGVHYYLKVGDDTGKIAFQNLNFNPSSSLVVSNGIYTDVTADMIKNIVRNDAITVPATDITVFFPTLDTQVLFGYTTSSVTYFGTSGNFVSSDNISLNIFNNDLVVELIETPLNGYDHGQQQTRNIITVISSGDVRSSTVARGFETYELTFTESAQFMYVGLRNKQTTLTYPQLTLRLTSQGKTLQMQGKISALLIFRDDEDSL